MEELTTNVLIQSIRRGLKKIRTYFSVLVVSTARKQLKRMMPQTQYTNTGYFFKA